MARDKFEVVLVVDCNGDYAVGQEIDDACDAYDTGIGGSLPRVAYRLTVDVPLPEPREANIHLADDTPAEIIATVEE
jgi:hypothetical protein